MDAHAKSTMSATSTSSSSPSTSHNLFEVYLRLRPPPVGAAPTDAPILTVEKPDDETDTNADAARRPSHITLNPRRTEGAPSKSLPSRACLRRMPRSSTSFTAPRLRPWRRACSRRRAARGLTRWSPRSASRALERTKLQTHTILGSKHQRGLTQLALDVLFRSIGPNMLAAADLPTVLESLQACDPSESALSTAPHFLESTFADNLGHSRTGSRAGTPMIPRFSSDVLGAAHVAPPGCSPGAYPDSARSSPKSVRLVSETDHNLELKKR
ncbi:hypothetical protein ACCO45_002779 [Purpureocillium lilacinum]|uniref:Uncharacterized protein n=1 Tax=Purpureocillium lilacinum TaxID=33203 RepID=A0ACC4E0T0_PURLI